ncbi:MAG: hypothetical protein HQL48_05130 [Gammaproteobacteria bacterium]|nr:hypothetical protein [Gammaproteobacteria bacterium]
METEKRTDKKIHSPPILAKKSEEKGMDGPTNQQRTIGSSNRNVIKAVRYP